MGGKVIRFGKACWKKSKVVTTLELDKSGRRADFPRHCGQLEVKKDVPLPI